VTGTFDNWGKTHKLQQTGQTFSKRVTLPATGQKILYKVRSDQ